ncbi:MULTISPECIES: hypothetical protein [Nostocales]|uniref:Uncharacterized protein n=3 Tax=Nostocales TaxID=1161 RepID=A0A8S9TJU1_9CYAN|nr:hypothetical protein DA73_0400031765 [Tolypothrix bouteillei VB521301]
MFLAFIPVIIDSCLKFWLFQDLQLIYSFNKYV